MPAPKKKIMGKGESPVAVGARVSSGGARATRKTVVKVNPKPNAKTETMSNVRVFPGGKSSKASSKMFNKLSARMVENAKSGRTARVKAEDIKERVGKATKKPTVKITGK